MDSVTKTLVHLISATDVSHRQDLQDMAKLAFLDYIASLGPAETTEPVSSLRNFLIQSELSQNALQPDIHDADHSGTTRANHGGDLEPRGAVSLAKYGTTMPRLSAQNRALYYGFASHFLDLDDAQANLAGHFSTVLYSALLAVLEPTDMWQDMLRAYIIGAELEGIIGALINPNHRTQGFHSTGTVGVIGAAAAIGALRGVTGESLAQLLSLAATQSSGMMFQSGSDGKPLHAGLAARNAVWAYELLRNTTLQTSVNPFATGNGWFSIIANTNVTDRDIIDRWLQPGQILQPGLWMKIYPYCSAAICGAEAAQRIVADVITAADAIADTKRSVAVDAVSATDATADAKRGKTVDASFTSLWPHIESVTVHFPPGADKALRYTLPTTGREGQFSIEYVIWQLFEYGNLAGERFAVTEVSDDATAAMKRIKRQNDLPPVAQDKRITAVEVTFTDGTRKEVTEDNPKGSPTNPLTLQDITQKLTLTIPQERIGAVIDIFTNDTIHSFISILKGEGVLHV